jgi:hypothetical protein
MQCPHCNQGIHEAFHIIGSETRSLVEGISSNTRDVFSPTEVMITRIESPSFASLETMDCPACGTPIFKVSISVDVNPESVKFKHLRPHMEMIWPRPSGNISPLVPKEYTDDFREAFELLPVSAKASAAMSRRTLQNFIRRHLGIEKKNLNSEIDAVRKLPEMPSSLGENLHAIREIGNFAAHPMKSEHTGEILPVEPGEAEFSLEVLRELFDHFVVKRATQTEQRAAINKKRAEAGKPPIQWGDTD